MGIISETFIIITSFYIFFETEYTFIPCSSVVKICYFCGDFSSLTWNRRIVLLSRVYLLGGSYEQVVSREDNYLATTTVSSVSVVWKCLGGKKFEAWGKSRQKFEATWREDIIQ